MQVPVKEYTIGRPRLLGVHLTADNAAQFIDLNGYLSSNRANGMARA